LEEFDPLEKTFSLISSIFPSKIKILSKERPYLIGREKGADIYMPHEAISRRHAIIEWRDGDFYIEDIGSKNGVFVNKKRIKRKKLLDNDLIEIYPWKIRFKEFRGDIDLLAEPEIKIEESWITQDYSEAIERLSSSPGLSGTFSEMEMLEICQLIEFNQKDGILRIKGQGKEGIITFSSGLIIHAESGNKKGEEAVRELLSLKEGNFEFQRSLSLLKGDLEIYVSKILIELAREMDENLLLGENTREFHLKED
jgi:hypothetical protein